MRNLSKSLRFIIFLLIIGAFMVKNTYAGEGQSYLESILGTEISDIINPISGIMDSINSLGSLGDSISAISENTTQSFNQFMHTIGENAEIDIYADIDADILQEISGENSRGIIELLSVAGLGKDSKIDIYADISADIEQKVDGKNNYGAVHILRVGTPVK